MERVLERVAITAAVADLICVVGIIISGLIEQGSAFQYGLLKAGIGFTVLAAVAGLISLILGFRSVRPNRAERRS